MLKVQKKHDSIVICKIKPYRISNVFHFFASTFKRRINKVFVLFYHNAKSKGLKYKVIIIVLPYSCQIRPSKLSNFTFKVCFLVILV